jgi:hypothetical protein
MWIFVGRIRGNWRCGSIPTMIFRRKGLGLAPWYGTLALFWLFSATFALAFFVGAFTVRPLKWSDLWVLALIGFMAWPPARFAWSLGSWIRRLRNYYLRIDDQGVQFHLYGAGEVQLAWHEIQSVTREKRWVSLKGPFPFAYRNYFYTVVTGRGRFAFTSMDIPRPARAAREIAARVGMQIQNIPAVR